MSCKGDWASLRTSARATDTTLRDRVPPVGRWNARERPFPVSAPNPNGIVSHSPGLHGLPSYPGIEPGLPGTLKGFCPGMRRMDPLQS